MRKEDGHHFLPNNVNDEQIEHSRILKPISIFEDVEIIPKPKWKCDKRENDYCMELSIGPEGYLTGHKL